MATLANSDVNFCFIPEVPLVLEGEKGAVTREPRPAVDTCRYYLRRTALMVVASSPATSLKK